MPSHLSIQQAMEDFAQDALSCGLQQRTVQCYLSSLSAFQKFLGEHGITMLTEINAEVILLYRHYLSCYRGQFQKIIAAGTQSQKLYALKSFLQFCIKHGRLLANVLDHLSMPKLPQRLPTGVLSVQQVKKILRLPDTSTATGFRDRIILELLYATGIRRNELTCLQVSDIFLQQRRIFIQHGKGGKQRWVPIGKKVSLLVKQYLQDCRPSLVVEKSHNYLLVNKDGNPISGDGIHTIVTGYLKKAGINSNCHGFRHTCATHLLKGKANIRVIQSLLGHASLSTTQIYTHVDITDLTKEMEKAHPRESMNLEEPPCKNI